MHTEVELALMKDQDKIKTKTLTFCDLHHCCSPFL